MARLILSGLLPLLYVTTPSAQDWKPAAGPLLTKWAKDVDPKNPLPEHPRPHLTGRPWLSLNGLWDYSIRAQNGPPPRRSETFKKILVPFPVESALSGVMERVAPDQAVWYRREFTVPADWAGKRVLLHFGAVDWNCSVMVDGKMVGEHQGGFDSFSFDITEFVQKSGPHHVVVRVTDPTDRAPQPRGKQVTKPGGIYYTPTTGIWQTVWLEAVPSGGYIRNVRCTTDIEKGQITIKPDVQGLGKGSWYTQVVISASGQEVAKGSGNKQDAVTLTLKDPKLWSPEAPFLYDVKVDLIANGTNDTVQTYVGMRKVDLGKDDQGRTVIRLNGKPVFQVGLLDQGFWSDGLYTAPTDEALRFDVEQTKRLGYNMIRKHVKVEPDRWYYWCDKLGLLVWQDMPSGDQSVRVGQPDLVRTADSAKIYERELKAMIDRLDMHPSIIMWVVFNEGWGQYDTKRITDWTRQYDPSRLVNAASGWNDHAGVGDVHDIHVYPGPGAPPPEEKRAIVLGEFGGLGLKVDGHTWEQRTWGYRGASDAEDLTRKYERLLAKCWELHREKGLSAVVYTQTTDVETEANGVFTYDRAVLKMDAERITAVNRGDLRRVPVPVVIVPTSEKEPQTYRYTLNKPEGDWHSLSFDDKAWTESPGGFGTRMTPGSVVRTEWKSENIWLRRVVNLPNGPLHSPAFLMHHDEDAEIYVNGVLAAKASGFTTNYEEVRLNAEGAKALKPGKNVIAIHCKQTRGGQYIDLGLVDFPPK